MLVKVAKDIFTTGTARIVGLSTKTHRHATCGTNEFYYTAFGNKRFTDCRLVEVHFQYSLVREWKCCTRCFGLFTHGRGISRAIRITRKFRVSVRGCHTRSWKATRTLQWRYNEHDCVSNHRRHDCSGADQRKHQSSTPLAFMWSISPVTDEFTAQSPVTRKMFPFDDVIMEIAINDWPQMNYSNPQWSTSPSIWCISIFIFCACLSLSLEYNIYGIELQESLMHALTWKRLPHYWTSVRKIYQGPINLSPKGQ